MKKYIIGFILGIVATISIGVFASIAASNVTYNNTTVDLALNSLYAKANEKVASLGNTYTNRLYSDNRGNKNLLLELESGSYICSVAYSNASVAGQTSVLLESGQDVSISNCDNYQELSGYKKYQTAKEMKNSSIFSAVLVGKNFYCNVSTKKNISIDIVANDPSNYYPVGLEASCTKLNMSN